MWSIDVESNLVPLVVTQNLRSHLPFIYDYRSIADDWTPRLPLLRSPAEAGVEESGTKAIYQHYPEHISGAGEMLPRGSACEHASKLHHHTSMRTSVTSVLPARFCSGSLSRLIKTLYEFCCSFATDFRDRFGMRAT